MNYYFPDAWAKYDRQRTPFMYELYEDMQQRKPYKNLKILHNLPLMISDLLKLDCLLASGAEITITMPKFVKSDIEAVNLVKNAQVDFIPQHTFADQYDVLLDCCAELAEVTRPIIGSIEITQTGANKYRRMRVDYPVISIDDSQLKLLEDSIGSADGFMRAIFQLIKEDLKQRKFIIFGFGKVGLGIASELKKISDDVTVIDNSLVALKTAKKMGYQTLNSQDAAVVEKHISDAFCVVTATGDKGFISRIYAKKPFENKYLVNMGAEDEFGEKFHVNDVLNEKMPVNFVLKEPTKIEYLDPVFYAHNTCTDLLLSAELRPGIYPLPKAIDNDILKKWFLFHNENRIEFNMILAMNNACIA